MPPFLLSIAATTNCPLLAECAQLARVEDFDGCLSCAVRARSQLPFGAGRGCAWAYSAWALFHLCRYSEAKLAVFSTLTELSVAGDAQSRLHELAKACDLLHTISDVGGNPGNQLRDGWYESQLRLQIQENRLKPPGGGVSDCCVLDESVNSWAKGTRNIVSHFDGGERDVQPGEFQPYPLSQCTGGVVHHKDNMWHMNCKRDCWSGSGPCYRCKRYPRPQHAFPIWEVESPSRHILQPHPELDVLTVVNAVPTRVHQALVSCLDKLASIRKDFPMPKYQNIIDPNVGSVDGIWVPTDVVASSVEFPSIDLVLLLMLAAKHHIQRLLPHRVVARITLMVGGVRFAKASITSSIPDLDARKTYPLYLAVQEVLTIALPLLARLRRPALLLPGPLQVVVKAQRIYLSPGEEYAGVWHQDGMRESIIAVVLYYYRASTSIRGGALEFVARDKSALWTGDGGGDTFTVANAKTFVKSLPRCQVTCQEGTLVVFSNYSTLHRVLPMIADAEGSRDFLAFFVTDQRHPLPSPPLPSVRERRARREEMLREQLRPRGRFGACQSEVYSTGNGSVHDIGWLNTAAPSSQPYIERAHSALAEIESLNIAPALGRGASYFVNGVKAVGRWDPCSSWEEHRLPAVGDSPERRFFVNTDTNEAFLTWPPVLNSISELVIHNNLEGLLSVFQQRYWTSDPLLEEWFLSYF